MTKDDVKIATGTVLRRFDDPNIPLAELARPVSALETTQRLFVATVCSHSASTGSLPDEGLGRLDIAVKRRREPMR
jgi:hypothetical protein